MDQALCDKSSLSGREMTEAPGLGNRAADLNNCDGIIRFEDC